MADEREGVPRWDGVRITTLREALGSIVAPLSTRKLARVMTERSPTGKRYAAATLERWEQGGEPTLEGAWIMSRLARMSFAQFALGVTDPVEAADWERSDDPPPNDMRQSGND